MLNRKLCRAAFGLALSAAFGVAAASAQDAPNETYLRGANRLSAGSVLEASSAFDEAIAAKSDDPRVYFLRGLCAARQNDPATAAAFYAIGAQLELASEQGRLSNVSEALAAVQGTEREAIEEARAAARADWKARESARQQAIYGESLARQKARLALPPTGSNAASDASVQNASGRDFAPASIRPFQREEVAAHQVPDLYDPNSDEFEYFREDLGRTELSTREKARLAAIKARVVYEDPMSKPAADGSPFINIYSDAEVFEDGQTFVGVDDPDSLYESEENNILTSISQSCQLGATAISLSLGAGTQNGSDGSAYSPQPDSYSEYTDGGYGSSQQAPAKVEPSASDDTKMLFEDAKPAASPFGEAISLDAANDFDLFQAGRDFKPAPATTGNASDPGMGAGPGSSMPPGGGVSR